jgi:hypothetical protein
MLAHMTSENIKQARTMVKEPRENLCHEARIPLSTWSRLESYGSVVPRVAVETMLRIEALFYKRGIMFLPPNGVERIDPPGPGELAA